jgi:hypothetical protein
MWGAALHDQATGIHRPLTATVLALRSLAEGATDGLRIVVALDHCLLRPREMQQVLEQTSQLTGIAESRLLFAFSHTHSGGHLNLDRVGLPGGEMIPEYLESLAQKLAAACLSALVSLQPATLSYAAVECKMGAQRDYWDAQQNLFVCGLNPDQPTDQSLLVARVTDENQRILATVVNYACHPTTLAWENSLISPDYVGALREVVEQATQAPCAFLLAPCGDIGPAFQYVGDPAVADRNGRQLGYAALSALESLPPAGTDYHYVGPLVSGATLGVWEHRPHGPERQAAAAGFRCSETQLDLPYLGEIPEIAQAERDLAALTNREREALAVGDEPQARTARALAERQRRLLDRIRPLPHNLDYPLPLWVWQIGDAFWVAIEGEPYNWLQPYLRQRFPGHPILITTIANGARCSYLPTREAYAKPLYQVDIALLAPGCLEAAAEAIATQIEAWCGPSGFVSL